MLINSPEHACSCSAGAKGRLDNEATASKTNAALMLSLSGNQRIRTAEFIYANKRERVCSFISSGPMGRPERDATAFKEIRSNH